MNEANPARTDAGPMNRDEMTSALFASMVMQQANMAMLYLGQMPHPETGQPLRDLDAARMFIDQLEMLEVKTRGNLTPEEASLLKQSLSAARMAFVEAVGGGEKENPASASAQGPLTEPTSEPAAGGAPAPEARPAGPDEDRKKFVKKY